MPVCVSSLYVRAFCSTVLNANIMKSFIPRLNRDQAHRKDKAYQSIVDQSFERYRPKGWVEEHHSLFTLASGLRWPLHVFSITLAALFALSIITQALTGDSLADIWTNRAERLPDLYAPLALVIAALLCLEWAKAVLFDQATTTLLKRKFAVGGFVFVVALALSAASFYSSVMGGDVWGTVSTTPEAAELQNPDQIRQYWTDQVNKTQGNIDRIEERLRKTDSWQDRRPGGTLDRLHKEKEKALERMAAEVDKAEATNTATKARAAVDGFFAGQILAYTSAGVEVLILLCLFYIAYHQYRVASEIESGVSEYQPEPAKAPHIGFNAFSPAAPMGAPTGISQPYGATEIGFPQAYRTATVHKGHGNRAYSKKGFPITCQHCGESAVMASPAARFCSEDCRKAAYEMRTGQKIRV